MNTIATVAIVIVGTLIVLLVIFKMMWRVAEPNEALIISGLRDHGPAGTGEDAAVAASGGEMEKLGLSADSLQVQEIEDPTGYINNLGMPHAAAVASQARIAQAQADRDATEQEQMADALKAEARRNSQIKQAGFQAEI